MGRAHPSSGGRHRHPIAAILSLVLVFLTISACNRAPLPETGSAEEELYAQRCGTCHRAYQPSTMTPAMWQMQVNAMELKMNTAGIPLTSSDKQTILAYLQRHASPPQ